MRYCENFHNQYAYNCVCTKSGENKIASFQVFVSSYQFTVRWKKIIVIINKNFNKIIRISEQMVPIHSYTSNCFFLEDCCSREAWFREVWLYLIIMQLLLSELTKLQMCCQFKAWVLGGRWSSHPDMIKQYARCVEERLASYNITDIELHVDVWRALNDRFQQRLG